MCHSFATTLVFHCSFEISYHTSHHFFNQSEVKPPKTRSQSFSALVDSCLHLLQVLVSSLDIQSTFRFQWLVHPIICVWACATKKFRKFWFTRFSCVPLKNSREYVVLWKGSPVFPLETFRLKWMFHLRVSFLKKSPVPRYSDDICATILNFSDERVSKWNLCHMEHVLHSMNISMEVSQSFCLMENAHISSKYWPCRNTVWH